MGIFIPFVHPVPYAADEGLAGGTGVFLIAVIGASSLVGRVFLTAAADRIGRRNSLAGTYVGMGVGFALWFLADQIPDHDTALLSAFAGGFRPGLRWLRRHGRADGGAVLRH